MVIHLMLVQDNKIGWKEFIILKFACWGKEGEDKLKFEMGRI